MTVEDIIKYRDYVMKQFPELKPPKDYELEIEFSTSMFKWWERPLLRLGLLKFKHTSLCRVMLSQLKDYKSN